MCHMKCKSLMLIVSAVLFCHSAARGEIEFVEVAGLPVEAGTPVLLTDGPFNTTIDIPSLTEPAGPVTDGDDFILWQRNSGSLPPDAENLPHLTTIGPGADYDAPAAVTRFEDVLGVPTPVPSPWFNPDGTPVRGYIGVQTTQQTGGDPHYGWIELTVEYDPLLNTFSALVHGYAYENVPGTSILAGATPEPATGAILLVTVCAVASRRRRT